MSSQFRLLSGRYRISSPAHIGGMSEIYEARDLVTDKKVAVKVFTSGHLDLRVLKESYSRELLALTQLKHENIVQLIDNGKDAESGREFLVLEWIDTDLRRLLQRAVTYDWDRLYWSIGRPLLEGLRFAHSRDVVHRDIKPSNILVDSDGTPKLTDFGVSKLRSYLGSSLTLKEFMSPPYSPPEADDGSYSATRDVFGISAVLVECLAQTVLTSHEDLNQALDRAPLPLQIHNIFKRALAVDPDKRHQNAAVFLAELDAIQESRRSEAIPRRHLFVEVSKRALNSLFTSYPTNTRDEVEALLLNDLNIVCGMTSTVDLSRPNSEAIYLYGGSFTCQAYVALPDEDHLVIVSAMELSPTLVEKRRNGAMPVNFLFRPGKPGLSSPGRETIHLLQEQLGEFRLQQALRASQSQELELFRSWSSVLEAKTAIETAKENPIRYEGYVARGKRILFKPAKLPSGDLAGQMRLVKVDGVVRVTGEVEYATDDEISFYVTNSYTAELPQAGFLSIDTEAATLAIQRQRAALKAVRSGRGVRSELGKLCVHPESSRAPTVKDSVVPIQTSIDDPKIAAVGAALGTEDFLLVEGPPGTGKTTFIVELILQSWKRNPGWRILLTSQTHVALDNALEGVIRNHPAFRVVRIGRPDNPRIARSVESVLLENQLDSWREEVLSRGRTFLEKWAGQHNISTKHVHVGIEFGKLAAVESEIQELAARRTGLEVRIQEITSRSSRRALAAPLGQGEDIETFQELDDELAKAKAEIRTRTAQRESIRSFLKSLDPDTVPLLNLPVSELHSWGEVYLPKSTSNQKLRRIFETHAEWQARFGRTADFQGALLRAAQVVAGTCVGIAGVKSLQEMDFDLCIVDEASKATPTETLVPLSRSRRWVVVGDQKQLPPFLEEGLRDPQLLEKFRLNERSVRATLFDRLRDLLPAANKTLLSTQYRMVPAIGELISHCFYSSALKSEPREWNRAFERVLKKPVVWISTSRQLRKHERKVGDSYQNETETRVIHSLLRKLADTARLIGKHWSVAVLTGYASQRAALQNSFARELPTCKFLDVQWNTVDAVQGREADVVIYSVTRSNPDGKIGFLRDGSRLNVALSRAKDYLILVGDHEFFETAPGENPFRKVIEYVESHPKDCVIEEAKA